MSKCKAVASGGVWINDNGKLPKRNDQDAYLTPRENVEVALDFLIAHERWLYRGENSRPLRILDLGSGEGVWGDVARWRWPTAFIHGVELRSIPKPDSYSLWSIIDMRSWDKYYASNPFDLVLGNPPYCIAEEAVRIGLSKVRANGVVAMLLPITFLTSQGRRDGLYKEHPLRYYAQFSQRISWTADGKTPPRDHALYCWSKGWRGEQFTGYFLPNAERSAEKSPVS